MSRLIYSDSFQDDEDLCNILAAIQLRDRPPANPPASPPSNNAPSPATCPPSGAVVDGNRGRNIVPIQQGHKDLQQGDALANPASKSRRVIRSQHRASIDTSQGKLPNVLILLTPHSL